MSFLYFAYGSNMLPARLQGRCKSARLVSRATAAGFGLEFSKVSKDGSGKATLFKAGDAATPGALFEVSDSDLGALDRAEGAGHGYDRHESFAVEVTGSGERLNVRTYIATVIDRCLKPYDWYLALVIAGARLHAFSDGYQTRLRAIDYVADLQSDRGERVEALEALQIEGFTDYRSLLV
jgi:hypothetical protein